MALRTTYISCVAHLFGLAALKERRMLHVYGFKNDELHAHGFKNDVYLHVWPRGFKRETNVTIIAHGFKNDVYFMCSPLVWPRGFKRKTNVYCYMRMALRTMNYMRMALRTTYISCVTRLFGLIAERYFLCLSPTDFR